MTNAPGCCVDGCGDHGGAECCDGGRDDAADALRKHPDGCQCDECTAVCWAVAHCYYDNAQKISDLRVKLAETEAAAAAEMREWLAWIE